MKQVLLPLLAFTAVAYAMPRYLVVPIENVRFMGEPSAIPIYPMSSFPSLNRVAREAADDEPAFAPRAGPAASRPVASSTSNRREDASAEAPLPGSFIGRIREAGIASAADNLAAGSDAYGAPPQGSDYVDYGAYTGKGGAFGWYSDHPVLLIGH